jgi:hypothetical protein
MRYIYGVLLVLLSSCSPLHYYCLNAFERALVCVNDSAAHVNDLRKHKHTDKNDQPR